jgi:hypothetical protein
MENFNLWARRGAVPEFEKEPNKRYSQIRNFAGAKARLSYQLFAARLKSCPCYKAPGCKAPRCKAPGYKAPGYKAPGYKAPRLRGSQI